MRDFYVQLVAENCIFCYADSDDIVEKTANKIGVGVGISEDMAGGFGTALLLMLLTVGVACCIVGVCPLLIAAGMDASDVVLGLCVSTLLLVVACAVFIFISKGMRWNAYEKLLQVGDFTKEQK